MNHDVDTTLSTLVAELDPAMAIVTTVAKDERAGCLIGFHTPCSIEPVRYAVWLSKANHTHRVALMADVVAVHFLARDQHQLAELFGGQSGDDIDKFERCAWSPGPGGVPLLDDCAHHFAGRKVAVLDEGSDHICLVVEPIEAHHEGSFRPLRLGDVQDIEPGHQNEERPTPPTERAG